jgi:pimeloyl-ACP methyl ester carboxylesterase
MQFNKVISKDGTEIAFDRTGQGPSVILVVGAFNERATGAPLAKLLEPYFTVFNYDRRGRGSSGDTAPYTVEREIEDLEALIAEAGGSAFVFGYSSGGVLALKAAAHGLKITKLALYEPPFKTGTISSGPPADLVEQLAELVSSDRRGDAVELFQIKAVGIPPEVVAGFRKAPFWASLEKIAHTLVYDATITGNLSIPAEWASSITLPTLVIAGGESKQEFRLAEEALAALLQNAEYISLEGQTHDIVPPVLAPVLQEFFGGKTP